MHRRLLVHECGGCYVRQIHMLVVWVSCNGCAACAEGKEGKEEAPKDGDKVLSTPAAWGQLALLSGILGLGALFANLGRPDVQEISFQHFKTHQLAAGIVDRVEVTNKTSAKVFVRPSGSRWALHEGMNQSCLVQKSCRH